MLDLIVANTPKDLLLRVVENAYSMAKIFSIFSEKFTNDVDDVSCVVRLFIEKKMPDTFAEEDYIDIAMYAVCNRVVALVVDYHNIMEYHETHTGELSYEGFDAWLKSQMRRRGSEEGRLSGNLAKIVGRAEREVKNKEYEGVCFHKKAIVEIIECKRTAKERFDTYTQSR